MYSFMNCTLHQVLFGWSNEVGGRMKWMVELRRMRLAGTRHARGKGEVHKRLVEKYEVKRPTGKPRRRWEDFKRDFQELE